MDGTENLGEDEDDGVIFEGSPLHQILVSTGSLADEIQAEVMGNQQPATRDHAALNTQTKMGVSSSTGNGKTKQIKDWISHHIFGLLSLLGLHQPDNMAIQRQQRIMGTLRSFTTLETDDADFLDWYLDQSDAPDVKPGTSYIQTSIILGTLLPCLCSYLYIRLSGGWYPWQHHPYQTLTDLVAMVSGLYLVARGSHDLHLWRQQKKISEEVDTMREMMSADEDLVTMQKKSLRLVQEIELVARGFTLVSQRNPLSRLEGGVSGQSTRQRQCPALRRAIFSTARETVHYLRQQTQALFDMCPVDPAIDVQSSFLAYEPLQSYGPCLQHELSTEEDRLYDLTDGFSVSALKGISHLLNLHQSEFVKALVLVYHHGNRTQGPSPVTDLVQQVRTHLAEKCKELSRSYTYHKCSLVSREPAPRTVRPQSQYEEIQVAIHSLDLHLQAALTRVRSVTQWIETQTSNNQSEDGALSRDLVTSMMQPIKAELDSCKGCWEEGVNRMESLWKKGSADSERDNEPLKPKARCEEDTESQEYAEIEDYIIVDQVFEAYTDPTEAQQDSGEWEAVLTPEEKEKKRREKQEALRMLTELKTVISVRAVETERREQAALLRDRPHEDTQKDVTCPPAECDTVPEPAPTEMENVSGMKVNTPDSRVSESVVSAIKSEIDEHSDVLPGERLAKTQLCQTHKPSLQKSNSDETNENVENPEDAKNIGNNRKHVEGEDLSHDRDKHSYVTKLGVRRLRKSTLLDLSDSDSEDHEEFLDERSSVLKSGGDSDEDNADEVSERLGVQQADRFRLPRFPVPEEYGTGANSEEEDEVVCEDSSFPPMKLPGVTLEERLGRLTGFGPVLSSSIAATAAARSRQFGGLAEDTFGGDVYGERSDSDDEVEDQVRTDQDNSEDVTVQDQ